MRHITLYRRLLMACNAALSAVIVALGLSSCEDHHIYAKYGVIFDDSTYVDTLVHCMYGVEPVAWQEVPSDEPDEAEAPAAE